MKYCTNIFCVLFILFLAYSSAFAQKLYTQESIHWEAKTIGSEDPQIAAWDSLPKNVIFISDDPMPYVRIELKGNFRQFNLKPLKESSFNANGLKALSIGAFAIRHHQKTGRHKVYTYVDVPVFRFDTLADAWLRLEQFELQYEQATVSATNTRTSKMQQGAKPLSEGKWLKFPVHENGIYKIDRQTLALARLENNWSPEHISLYSAESSMLPQVYMPGEKAGALREKPLHYDAAEDYLLFYAESAHEEFYDKENNIIDHHYHLYSDTAYYFIRIDGPSYTPMPEREAAPVSAARISSFTAYQFLEEDQHNILRSGRHWLGQRFDAFNQHSFPFDFALKQADTPVKVKASVIGQSFEATKFTLFTSNQPLGEIALSAIPNQRYAIKGSWGSGEYALKEAPEDGNITLRYDRGSAISSLGYLRKLSVEFEKHTQFHSEQQQKGFLQQSPAANYNIAFPAIADKTYVFDLSEDIPVKLQSATADNMLLYNGSNRKGAKFASSTKSALKTVKSIKTVENQHLSELNPPNLLIITHASLKPAADRLANFRQQFEGIASTVVTTEAIYNEYSGGKQDVSAIRNFVADLYQRDGEQSFKYLLLLGRGSYDYKNILSEKGSLVPTYQSRNFLHPIFSYASDDYFGFLDPGEGQWEETQDGDHMLDIGIGRLPVDNIEEANAVIDKLVRYNRHKNTFGDWQQKFLFIADDGDNNLHHRDADAITNQIYESHSAVFIDKLYLGQYPQVETPARIISPAAKNALKEKIDLGALIINFNGHGSANVLTEQHIVDPAFVAGLDNFYKMPLFVTATCEFGRFDDPERRSSGENLLLNGLGGGIGLVTTSRPVFANTNFQLNKAFYDGIFHQGEKPVRHLGDIFTYTKNTSLSGPVNRNFVLLGDPSMRLALPEERMVIDSITVNGEVADTLKGLDRITVSGKVLNPELQPDSRFNGVFTASLYDSPDKLSTLSENGPLFEFEQFQNTLYRGSSEVKNGTFSFSFTLPKHLNYDVDYGKITLWAKSYSDRNAINGNFSQVGVGGLNGQATPDLLPPELSLYLNDSSFKDGGLTGTEATLKAYFYDESGINIASHKNEYRLNATLDDSLVYYIDNYYEATNHEGSMGEIAFPLRDLAPGHHTLKVSAWDNHLNESTSNITFRVGEDAKLLLSNVFNYPNPFSNATNFSFEHNKSGEDLDIAIQFFSSQGAHIATIKGRYDNSPGRIDNLHWNGSNSSGAPLQEGIYIYKLVVRSRTSQTSGQQQGKLIVIN